MVQGSCRNVWWPNTGYCSQPPAVTGCVSYQSEGLHWCCQRGIPNKGPWLSLQHCLRHTVLCHPGCCCQHNTGTQGWPTAAVCCVRICVHVCGHPVLLPGAEVCLLSDCACGGFWLLLWERLWPGLGCLAVLQTARLGTPICQRPAVEHRPGGTGAQWQSPWQPCKWSAEWNRMFSHQHLLQEWLYAPAAHCIHLSLGVTLPVASPFSRSPRIVFAHLVLLRILHRFDGQHTLLFATVCCMTHWLRAASVTRSTCCGAST
jgi:hypothetical protein